MNELKCKVEESAEAGCSRASREVVTHEGYWGYSPIQYCVDGTKPDGTHFMCCACQEACVNPVIVGCNHVSCRSCLDDAAGRCPGCKAAFYEHERVYLNKSLGAEYWEFNELLGMYGRGRGTKYEVLWASGEVTREPASFIPAEARKKFLKARKLAKKQDKKKFAYSVKINDLKLNFKKI